MYKIIVGLLLLASPFEAAAQTPMADGFRLEDLAAKKDGFQFHVTPDARLELKLAPSIRQENNYSQFFSGPQLYDTKEFCGSFHQWEAVTSFHNCVVPLKRPFLSGTLIYRF